MPHQIKKKKKRKGCDDYSMVKIAAAVVVITLDPVSPQLDQEMNITCRRQVMAGNSTSDYHCRWTLNNNKIWTNNNEIIHQCSVKV